MRKYFSEREDMSSESKMSDYSETFSAPEAEEIEEEEEDILATK